MAPAAATARWRRPLRHAFVLALATAGSAASALDLAQAWQAAQVHDPQWRAARAAAASNRERVPQALAQLRPQVSVNLQRWRNEQFSEQPLGTRTLSEHRFYTSASDSFTVRQPLFRPQASAELRQARALVESGEATLRREEQNLATRLTRAYLEALLAEEQLRLNAVQHAAFQGQLASARRGFAAGSGTRTDIDEAQARLDLNVAEQVQARQAVDFTRRQLAVIVGEPVTTLAPVVPQRLPMTVPQPASLDAWLARAEAASPELRAASWQLDAAREAVRKVRAAGSPTLDLVGQISRSDSDNPTRIDTRYFQKSVGVQLNVPLYQGGAVASQERQALAEVQRQESVVDGLRQDLAVRVQREFRGVTEGIARVRALEQALRSSQQLVLSNRRSQQAGSRTVVDILNAEQQLGQTRRDLAQARFDYLLSLVSLKALAGEMDDASVAQLNGWLDSDVPASPPR